MTLLLNYTVPGNLGNVAGANADGVLLGKMTAAAAAKALLKSRAVAGLCITDDGGAYTDETTPFGEATGDDVEVLPATPAVGDAVYFGHATLQFDRVDLNLTTDGDGTWTIAWEYWNGTEFTALADVTDGTGGFIASATGWLSVTYTLPGDWAKNTVDGVNAYWIRARVATYSAVTTAPQVGQGYIITQAADAGWTDDTEDFNDSGAGDVAALPAYPIAGDGLYIGHATQKFCKVRVTVSQARTGTATITWKYWNGSAWTALTSVDDDSVGFSAGTSTYLVHFTPPADWVANTGANGPNGQAGYFVVAELTAITSVTAQPLITQGWVFPLTTGAGGMAAPVGGTITRVDMGAGTKSGTTADSKFILVNVSQGTCVEFTWTKAEPIDYADVSLAVSAGDELALVQITEDGTTEFADANFQIAM